MRNGRRNWNSHDRAGNQHQPGIVFRTPGNGFGNGQGNQNSHDKGKGKDVSDDGANPKGPCQICWKMGHTAADCWHRFKKNYVPQPSQRRELRGAYVAATDGQSSGAWYLDSGATNHVTNALGNININSEYQGNEKLTVGNGEKLLISHVGNSMLSTSNPHKHITLNDILFVPSITKNLISISRLLHDNDIDIEFQKFVCFIKDKRQGKILVKGVAREGLYELLCLPTHLSGKKTPYAAVLSSSFMPESINCISNPVSTLSFNLSSVKLANVCVESSETDRSSNDALRDIDLWHLRLGHPNESALKSTLLSCNQFKLNKNYVPLFCCACQ